jgi:hypothetical protein
MQCFLYTDVQLSKHSGKPCLDKQRQTASHCVYSHLYSRATPLIVPGHQALPRRKVTKRDRVHDLVHLLESIASSCVVAIHGLSYADLSHALQSMERIRAL